MHTNLNYRGDQYFDPQPLLLPTNYLGPSPQLSPILLTLLNPEGYFESSNFRLQLEPNLEYNHFSEAHIDDLSPPIPHPTDEFMMVFDQKQQAQDQHQSEEMQLYQIKREQEPSLKSVQTKAKPVSTLKLSQGQILPIRAMIQFLVQNSCIDEPTLIIHGKQFCQENIFLQDVFKILIRKFKNLHKTKQEMTKYCMRKAFKFVADRMKRDRTHNRDVDNCMKQYFSKNQGGNTFSIPFKKNSVQKTMNGNFLKKVFASTSFKEDYSLFLKQLRSLIAEDNDKKILYIAEFLEKCVKTNDLRKVESIKRLPWTRETLIKTEKLGFSLRSYAQDKSEKQEEQ